mmetsp:Transcript_77486/g.185782  ORF Transcript_77486/g.185782 Transcript_77486/m.185782 type:complete len:210 (-) Transcript_77486:1272-1901(-)
MTPPSQDVEQADHSDQSVITQSTGQLLASQGASCSASPTQLEPPSRPGSTTSRKRWITPPSQDLLQGVQELHSSHWQSTGQLCVLQGNSSAVSPSQGVPPSDSSLTMLLVRRDVPPPQVALQTVKLVHSLQWQSSGQGCSLQDSSSIGRPSQSAPPLAGATQTIRFFRFFPPPQEAEHASNSVQAPHSQSNGQGWALQASSSATGPWQP